MPRDLIVRAPVAFPSPAASKSLPSSGQPASSRRPVVLLGLGLTLSIAAAGVLAARPEPATDVRSVPLTAPIPSGRIVLNGEGDIAVLTAVYEPGQSSGWHVHAGVHAVAVLSGEMTVYEGDCVPQRFGPGTPYVGGRELHLVRNETAQPAEMVVTYLNPAGAAGDAGQLAPPPNCNVT